MIHPADARKFFILILDDVQCDKQDKITEYFSMCQHKSLDAAYLMKELVMNGGSIVKAFVTTKLKKKRKTTHRCVLKNKIKKISKVHMKKKPSLNWSG